MKPHLNEQWVIPPEQNARFVAKMEDVLSVYKRPYDEDRPVVCMDEMSRQLLKHVREPTDPKPGTPRRHDHHYERNGTVNLFTFFEPLAAHRVVFTRDRRTKVDWAECVRRVLDEHYPQAQTVVLVMDNLNTHGPSSLYEAFGPTEARRLAERLEIHYTPEHGSWLNMAEIEQSVMARQALSRRVPDRGTMERRTTAWQKQRNAADATVDWQFTTEEARIKLKRLYPKNNS
ncbi:MAG: IS630 family transposase [Bacteroidetes bacterium QH_6_63_17]|nr:MAG: IS630 family transposase [Bacteroidetes bacterium QH_6_63_17]